MKELLTTAGYSFEVLLQEIIDENLSIGRYGLLVDFPEGSAVNDCPLFATYRAEDIVNWKVEIVRGKHQLTLLVLRDCAQNVVAGDEIEYLKLEINDQGFYQSTRCKVVVAKDRQRDRVVLEEEPIVPMIKGKALTEIPFIFINPYDLKADVEKPPFLDLVNMNMGHYRNSADYEHALFLTAQPTPWIAGQLDETKKPKAIGSGTIWYLPKETTCGMLEFQGAGLEAQRLAMQDKEERMAALGARMIKDSSDKQETAETARLRGRSEMSLLTSVVNMTEAGLEKAFKIAAEWVGANPDDVELNINTDFVETRMDSLELTALVKAWQSGAISRETLHENLQKGEIIPGSRTVDEEKQLIEKEGDQLGGFGVGAVGIGMQNVPQPPAQTGQSAAGGGSTPSPQGKPPKTPAPTGKPPKGGSK
jgi:hypothetical protein